MAGLAAQLRARLGGGDGGGGGGGDGVGAHTRRLIGARRAGQGASQEARAAVRAGARAQRGGRPGMGGGSRMRNLSSLFDVDEAAEQREGPEFLPRSRSASLADASLARDLAEAGREAALRGEELDEEVEFTAFELRRSVGLRAISSHNAETRISNKARRAMQLVVADVDKGDDALKSIVNKAPLQERIAAADYYAEEDDGGEDEVAPVHEAWTKRVRGLKGITEAEELIIRSRVLQKETQDVRRFAATSMAAIASTSTDNVDRDRQAVLDLHSRIAVIDKEEEQQELEVHAIAAICNTAARNKTMTKRKTDRTKMERSVMVQLAHNRKHLATECYERMAAREKDIASTFKTGPLLLKALGEMIHESCRQLALDQTSRLLYALERVQLPTGRADPAAAFDPRHRKVTLNPLDASPCLKLSSGNFCVRHKLKPVYNPVWGRVMASQGPWLTRREGTHRAQPLVNMAIDSVTKSDKTAEWISMLARVFDAVHPEATATDPGGNMRLKVSTTKRPWVTLCKCRDLCGYPSPVPDLMLLGDNTSVSELRLVVLSLLESVNERMNVFGTFYFEVNVPPMRGDKHTEWCIGVTAQRLPEGSVPGCTSDSWGFFSNGMVMHDNIKRTYMDDLSDQETVGFVLDLTRGSMGLVLRGAGYRAAFGMGSRASTADQTSDSRKICEFHLVPVVALRGRERERPRRKTSFVVAAPAASASEKKKTKKRRKGLRAGLKKTTTADSPGSAMSETSAKHGRSGSFRRKKSFSGAPPLGGRRKSFARKQSGSGGLVQSGLPSLGSTTNGEPQELVTTMLSDKSAAKPPAPPLGAAKVPKQPSGRRFNHKHAPIVVASEVEAANAARAAEAAVPPSPKRPEGKKPSILAAIDGEDPDAPKAQVQHRRRRSVIASTAGTALPKEPEKPATVDSPADKQTRMSDLSFFADLKKDPEDATDVPFISCNFGGFRFLMKPDEAQGCDAYLPLRDEEVVEGATGGGGDAEPTPEELAAERLREFAMKNTYIRSLQNAAPRSWSEFPAKMSKERKEALKTLQGWAKRAVSRMRQIKNSAAMVTSGAILERFALASLPRIRGKRHYGAINVQRMYRGHRVRVSWRLQRIKYRRSVETLNMMATRIQRRFRLHWARTEMRRRREALKDQIERTIEDVLAIQRCARAYIRHTRHNRIATYHRAARVIQVLWRGVWTRIMLRARDPLTQMRLTKLGRMIRRQAIERVAAESIQRVCRGWVVRNVWTYDPRICATKIQQWWRDLLEQWVS